MRSASRVTGPSVTELKSRLVFHAPLAQTADPVREPEKETERPFSLQVPETENAPTFTELITDPGAGEVIATVGTMTSFVKFRVRVGAGFPAESERFKLIETGPAGAEVKSIPTDQSPSEQLADPAAEPVMITVRPFSEQAPFTMKFVTDAAVM